MVDEYSHIVESLSDEELAEEKRRLATEARLIESGASQNGDYSLTQYQEQGGAVVTIIEGVDVATRISTPSGSPLANWKIDVKNDGTIVESDPKNPENQLRIKLTEEPLVFDTTDFKGLEYEARIRLEDGSFVDFTVNKGGETVIERAGGSLEGEILFQNGEKIQTIKDGKLVDFEEQNSSPKLDSLAQALSGGNPLEELPANMIKAEKQEIGVEDVTLTPGIGQPQRQGNIELA